MIKQVTLAKTIYADLPNRFEAGTPDIAGAIGLGAAIDYLQAIGLDNAAAHEALLLRHATARVQQIPGVRLIGTASHKAAVLSFIVEDPPLAVLDVGARLDLEGIAVRTGHHCCQPLMDRFGLPGTVRASFALYNTLEEVDRFADCLRKIVTEAATKAKAPLPLLPPEPAFPAAVADSPEKAAEEMIEVFEFFDDWNDRYHHILELGEKLPPMSDDLKIEANRVHGCQSIVHLVARRRPGTENVLEFLADSNADLVRGLIALLERVFSGQRADQILAFDVEGFFSRLGLDQHLTLGRRNGLAAMVQRIRSLAANLATRDPVAPLESC